MDAAQELCLGEESLMKQRGRYLLKQALASWPVWDVLGPILRQPGVAVLMYHRVGVEDSVFPNHRVEEFADQMRWLRQNCTPIHPRNLHAAAATARSRRPPVLVTFDDGYRDYHDFAYPILKSLDIPAVVFLSTGLIDSGGLLWTDLVNLAMLRSPLQRVTLPWLGGGIHTLGNADERLTLAAVARKHLKSLPDMARRAAVEQWVAALAPDPASLHVERQMLSWDEVRATRDLTIYGGHGHTHAILSRASPTALNEEIGRCQERIVAELGAPADLFAYPNGQPPDFDANVKKTLWKYGFSTVFSTIAGINGPTTDWSEVRRLAVFGNGINLAWMLYRPRHTV